jgi:hypothetical protein
VGAEMNEREALKLGLQLVETAEYLATDAEICGKDAKEERALIQRSKIAFEEALAQSDQESDDLTIAYMSGFHDGKNKDAPQRTWVGLTDEDKNDCLVSADPCECLAKPESHQLMEDVEAKLKEKNCG